MADLNNGQVDTLVSSVLTTLLLSPDQSTWTYANAVDFASMMNDDIGADTVNGIVGRFVAKQRDGNGGFVEYVIDFADN